MNFHLHPKVKIGHIHLSVSNLERSTAFYRDVLGFNVTAYGPDFGMQASFLSAGNYHHHIALNTWRSKDAMPPPKGHTGLYHFAILYPDKYELAKAVRHLIEIKYPIDSAEDHGGTLSVYLRDPDCNSIELYYDRENSEWYDPNGNLVLKAEPFDLNLLLKEID